MESRKILIVDDEPDIREFLAKVLGDRLRVMLAPDGLDAIARMERERFDLVLTDVRMPGADGLQVLEAAKRISPHCEVLLMSGYADMEGVIQAMNEGGFAFVTKPVRLDLLGSRIDNALAVLRARESQEQVLHELKGELLMQSQFAQRLSALAAMAGGIAHELHQPLSGISLYSATLKRMVEKERKVEGDYLLATMDKIDQQVARAIGVIEHIREFSAGSPRPRVSRMKLRTALTRALELLNLQLQAQNIAIAVDVPDDAAIHADQNQFEQVIINLVSNARDAILERMDGGPQARPREIRILGVEAPPWVVVDIQDSGIGVPKHLVDGLFEPFVTGKRERGGSGLGLFICRRVLEEFGAELTLHATGGSGSTFRIRFPELAPNQAR